MYSEIIVCIVSIFSILMTILGLPGNTLMLLAVATYAFINDFAIITLYNLGIISLFYLLGELWELALGYLGIKRENVSWTYVAIVGVGTFIGGIWGAFVIPIVGSLLGVVVGAFVTTFALEYFVNVDCQRAFELALISAKNQLLAVAGKMAFGILMFVLVIKYMFFG